MADYLLVGHITRDVPFSPRGGFKFGGAVLYAGLSARRLGFWVSVLTASAEKDLELLFPELLVHNIPSEFTTTFINEETEQGRRQWVLAKARPIRGPKERKLKCNVLHIAPVLDELGEDLKDILGLTEYRMLVGNPQGWFRRVDEHGRVHARMPEFSRWPKFYALVVSEEDVALDPDYALKRLLEKCKVLVVTKGEKGAELFYEGRRLFLRAPKAEVVKDTTGAGDVFSGTFFGLLFRGLGPENAARVAVDLATISVTREGLRGVPTAEEVLRILTERG